MIGSKNWNWFWVVLWEAETDSEFLVSEGGMFWNLEACKSQSEKLLTEAMFWVDHKGKYCNQETVANTHILQEMATIPKP